MKKNFAEIQTGSAEVQRLQSQVRALQGELALARQKCTALEASTRTSTGPQVLTEKLLQQQRTQTIASLAPGMVHEINNVLMIICGYSHLLLAEFSEASPARKRVLAINQAAERGGKWLRQMLNFGRHENSLPEVLNLNAVIQQAVTLLSPALGHPFELCADLSADAYVRADAGHVERIIMNLVINARDAMPDGGRITLETTTRHFSQEENTPSGKYVRLAVRDTGAGVAKEHLDNIFNSFFTTTPDVTGLGLATVQSLVKQNNGHIRVESTPGSGTTFSVYLPQADRS